MDKHESGYFAGSMDMRVLDRTRSDDAVPDAGEDQRTDASLNMEIESSRGLDIGPDKKYLKKEVRDAETQTTTGACIYRRALDIVNNYEAINRRWNRVERENYAYIGFLLGLTFILWIR